MNIYKLISPTLTRLFTICVLIIYASFSLLKHAERSARKSQKQKKGGIIFDRY